MNHLETYLKIGGLLHFGILLGSAMVPKALDWRTNLAMLHPFIRRLFWVYGVFIVLVIISFGALTLRFSNEMIAGSPFARGVCLFIAIFWLARVMVQFFVFDARPFLTNWFYKIGYHGLTVVFIYFTLIYGRVALF